MAFDEGLSPDAIRQLFCVCDLNGNGYIERSELASVCNDLDSEELSKVFQALDLDGDGRISMRDFSAGFHSVGSTLLALSRRRRRQQLLESAQTQELETFLEKLDSDFDLFSSQEQVCELYQQLHTAELPHCLSQFETIIFETIKDIKQQQAETTRLEQSLKRANESHTEHLQHIELEMETQMTKLEARVREEEKETAIIEKEELKKRLEAEITELQANLSRFHSFEKRWHSREKPKDEALKKKLDELQHENRQLKSSLTEASTTLAITRSELAAFKSEYDECMDSDKSLLHEYMYDHDSLARQVQLLQEANRRLQDTNDDLRATVDSMKRYQHQRSRSVTPTNQKRNAFSMVHYGEDSPLTLNMAAADSFSRRRRSLISQDSVESESPMLCLPGSGSTKRRFVYHQTADGESYPDEVDSGNSTLRDPHELDSELESNCVDEDIRRATPIEEITIKEAVVVCDNQQPTQTQRVESITDDVTALNKSDVTVAKKSPVHEPVASLKNERLQRNISPRNSGRKRALPQVPTKFAGFFEELFGSSDQEEIQPKRPQSPPERMYKIVLAGDAAVGKSSFIMRLCKGIFQSNLNSTLGVDFQMKTIEIDDKVTSLQLWDTAGQERFRSIAKSYFRRADGVLLLYDCTYERSFINVRDWIEAIEEGANKPIPVMICANKVDARASAQAEGIRCVRTEDGERLASSFNALFIECSAKDGSNVEEAVEDLTRKLHKREDKEVSESGLSLTNNYEKKNDFKCCI
ncbi:ras and EF-hand domain-containing protein homolog isoform X3 [Asterias amurensis]|uniref:ras and EF-hand domain-containing protein homolog isoform X3 n=1 Tax=Asterias amurensis TaxID=7602 RepID=UPI003AB15624